MRGSSLTFGWRVPDAGYRWSDVGATSSAGQPVRALVEQGEPALSHHRLYDPLGDRPALFREFAQVPPTEQGILDFANKWGALGEADRIIGDTPLASRPAELFTAWVRSISEMRCAVWIWFRLTSKTEADQHQLLKHVLWITDEENITRVVFDSHPHLPPGKVMGDDGYLRVVGVIASDEFGSEGLAQFQRGEVSQPARVFLSRLVNAALCGRVSPQTIPDEMSPRIEPGKLPVLFSLRLVPSKLYAALWLQLAQAMTSYKEQRECLGCKEWFEVKKKGPHARSDRLYCSDACRKRVYRERREVRKQLHADGKKVKEIAQEIGAEVDQVKSWIANRKG